jgi:hypothetical protein
MKLNDILKMDSDSQEYFEIYQKIVEKYWDIKNPNDYQLAAKTLAMFGEKYNPEQVIVAAKIVLELFEMHQEKKTAMTGHVVFEKDQYYFDIYTSEVEKDGLNSLLKRAGKELDKKMSEL